jgi:hypothetical protein
VHEKEGRHTLALACNQGSERLSVGHDAVFPILDQARHSFEGWRKQDCRPAPVTFGQEQGCHGAPVGRGHNHVGVVLL